MCVFLLIVANNLLKILNFRAYIVLYLIDDYFLENKKFDNIKFKH
jgi:hypothetical protein